MPITELERRALICSSFFVLRKKKENTIEKMSQERRFLMSKIYIYEKTKINFIETKKLTFSNMETAHLLMVVIV